MYKNDNKQDAPPVMPGGLAIHRFPGGVRCTFSDKSKSVTIECRGRVVDVFPFDATMRSVGDYKALLSEVRDMAAGRRRFQRGFFLHRRLRRIRAGYYGM